MSYLVDTNVISELRKGDRASPHVRAWVGSHHAELLTSVLVIGELRRGVERIRHRDQAAAAGLDRWLRGVLDDFETRILPVSSEIAEVWGRLGVPDPLPVIDGLIGATAVVHGVTVVSRNVEDLRRTGADVLNPFMPPP